MPAGSFTVVHGHHSRGALCDRMPLQDKYRFFVATSFSYTAGKA